MCWSCVVDCCKYMPKGIGVALRHVISRLSVLLRAEMLHVTFPVVAGCWPAPVCAGTGRYFCFYFFFAMAQLARVGKDLARAEKMLGAIKKEIAPPKPRPNYKRAAPDELDSYAGLKNTREWKELLQDVSPPDEKRRKRSGGARPVHRGVGKLRTAGGSYGSRAVLKNKKWSRNFRRRRGRRLVARFIRAGKRISSSSQQVVELETVNGADQEHSWAGYSMVFEANEMLTAFELVDPAKLVVRGSTGVVPVAAAFQRDDFRDESWFYCSKLRFVFTFKNPVAVPLNVSMMVFSVNDGADVEHDVHFWKDAPPYLMKTFKNQQFRRLCRRVLYYKKMVVAADGVGSFRADVRPGFLQAFHGEALPEHLCKIVRYGVLLRAWFPMQNEGTIGEMPTFYNLKIGMNAMSRVERLCYVPADSNLKSSSLMYNWTSDDPKFGQLKTDTFVSSDLAQVPTRAKPAA